MNVYNENLDFIFLSHSYKKKTKKNKITIKKNQKFSMNRLKSQARLNV